MPPGFDKLFEWGPPYVALGALAFAIWRSGKWIGVRLFDEETDSSPGGLVTQWFSKQNALLESSKTSNDRLLAGQERQEARAEIVERRINDILASARDPNEQGELVDILMDQLPVPLAQVNEQGYFMRSNSALRQVLGYTEDELGAMTVSQVTPAASDVAAETDARQKTVRGVIKSFRIEKTYRRKDGMDVFCALHVFRFPQIGPFRFYVSCVIPLHPPHTLR